MNRGWGQHTGYTVKSVPRFRAGGKKTATPQGPALDGSPKGCYAYGSDGGHIEKSVPEFVAVGEQLTTSLWGTVKGGGSCWYLDIVHFQYT